MRSRRAMKLRCGHWHGTAFIHRLDGRLAWCWKCEAQVRVLHGWRARVPRWLFHRTVSG